MLAAESAPSGLTGVVSNCSNGVISGKDILSREEIMRRKEVLPQNLPQAEAHPRSGFAALHQQQSLELDGRVRFQIV